MEKEMLKSGNNGEVAQDQAQKLGTSSDRVQYSVRDRVCTECDCQNRSAFLKVSHQNYVAAKQNSRDRASKF